MHVSYYVISTAESLWHYCFLQGYTNLDKLREKSTAQFQVSDTRCIITWAVVYVTARILFAYSAVNVYSDACNSESKIR